MTHFFGTRRPDPSTLASIQGAVVGLDLEDVFQVTQVGLVPTSQALTVGEQEQTARAIAAGVLGPGEPGPRRLFTRNVSPVDVWTLAHLGVGVGLAVLGLGPLALAVVAGGTEAVEFVLQREGILQQETIQNRIGDVVAAGIGFAAARALV